MFSGLQDPTGELVMHSMREVPAVWIDRRISDPSTTGLLCHLLARALDEVDYGVALMRAEGRVLHMNDEARRRLRDGHGLYIADSCVCVRHPHAVARFAHALQAAALHGARRLVDIGDGETEDLVALVPMGPQVAGLLLGKASACEELAVAHFASMHALTLAESRVLAALCTGAAPAAIASAQGVKLSTVRTQIGAIREKTGATSITGLVRLIAALPPMVNALHH
jgi:DNA-binding CsgD family transcriptional regulator